MDIRDKKPSGISGSARRSAINRADLLACLAFGDEGALAAMAEFAGFELKEKEVQVKKQDVITVGTERKVFIPSVPAPPPVTEWPLEPFYYVSHYEQIQRDEADTAVPAWLAKVKPLTDEEMQADPSKSPPSLNPLTPWPRLWPFLRVALGDTHVSKKIDIDFTVDKIARGRVLERYPCKRHQGWAKQCRVLVDYNPYLLPFWDDFNDLCHRLEKLHGSSGLEIFKFEHGPDGPCRRWGEKTGNLKGYLPPESGTPTLVLSDLGCLAGDHELQHRWRQFGKRLKALGEVVALMPCPQRLWNRDLRSPYSMAVWDRNSRLPRKLQGGAPWQGKIRSSVQDHGVERLLTLLSPAIRVEPGLLRAVRHLLPAGLCDVGCEAAVWNHERMCPTPLATIPVDYEARRQYRTGFENDIPMDLQDRVKELIHAFHDHLPPAVRMEESGFADPDLVRRLVKTYRLGADEDWQDWVRRWGWRLMADGWKKRELAAVWAIVHKEELQAGRLTELPTGFDPALVAWVFKESLHPKSYVLLQEGEKLVLELTGQGHGVGSPLHHDLTFTLPVVTRKAPEADQSDERISPKATGIGERLEMALPPVSPLYLESDHEQVTIEAMARPEWAKAIGRDVYGLYAEFEFKGIRQVMRWIPPGRFLMGSPDDEPERSEREKQHEVIISQGCWLADTACTQGLWQAVTGENPSNFKGDERPVDSVSYEDVQEFLRRINESAPGLNLRLPTEAEWEYGCRAGTTTPFFFGDNITTDQVNYDGNYPYNNGEKGESRRETVPVKGLPCNSWGLYQMHGNVWEWCADWFGDYPSGMVIDPEGPELGEGRVLRGGSWFHLGRYVRSASRVAIGPSDRGHFFGFRFARGQWGREVQAGKGRQDRPGEAERRRPGPGDKENMWQKLKSLLGGKREV